MVLDFDQLFTSIKFQLFEILEYDVKVHPYPHIYIGSFLQDVHKRLGLLSAILSNAYLTVFHAILQQNTTILAITIKFM